MAHASDATVVPLRLPRALAPRSRLDSAAAPDDIIATADVDAALDVYDLSIGCKGVQVDPDGSGEGDTEQTEAAMANAQVLASLALQYIEAR